MISGEHELQERFVALTEVGSCQLVGGQHTHDKAQYIVSKDTALAEYLRLTSAQDAVTDTLAAATQDALLDRCSSWTPTFPTRKGSHPADPEVLTVMAEALKLRSALLWAWWSPGPKLMKIDRERYTRRIT